MRDLENKRKWSKETIDRRKREWFLSNGPCVHCGSWENLEADHIDPSMKKFCISWLWLRPTVLYKELEKCQVLCRACHQKKTMIDNPQLQKKPLIHGTLTAYKSHGCRCQDCRIIVVQRERDRRAGLL